MFCKIVSRETDGLVAAIETSDITGPLDRTEAQRRFTELVCEKSARPTSKGWLCRDANGSLKLFTLERCGSGSDREQSHVNGR
jgi:hypothetical protein